jgi:hypothetical protein
MNAGSILVLAAVVLIAATARRCVPCATPVLPRSSA